MHTADHVMMQRCLDLAWQGAGNVAPNPMVGCVIVHEGKIIGEGFHKKFGEPHAEVNAISAVNEQQRSLLSSSTLYVNLEPCSHYGKTPPCADLIIENKIHNVVIGCVDPNPLVQGTGIEKLKAAGCRLLVGVMEQECRKLNKRFFTFIEKKRPYVILKWAQTQDGFIAPADKSRMEISNEFSRTLAHKWRSEEAAVMVGTETALQDNPRLNARLWNNHHPIRIVLDRTLRLPSTIHLFDHSIPAIVFTEKQRAPEENLQFITIDFGENVIENILKQLYEMQIQSVFMEGGAILLQTFIDTNFWDEARIFISPKFFTSGIPAPKLNGVVVSGESIDEDRLIIMEN